MPAAVQSVQCVDLLSAAVQCVAVMSDAGHCTGPAALSALETIASSQG